MADFFSFKMQNCAFYRKPVYSIIAPFELQYFNRPFNLLMRFFYLDDNY